MNKDLFVEIFVPTGVDRGLFATGYPICRDRILTARHFLFDEKRDAARPIELRWHYQSETARRWIPCEEDAVRWDGGEACDAAVLACDFPDGVDDWGIPSGEALRAPAKWQSAGFATAGRKAGRSSAPVGLKGEAFPMSQKDTTFELAVDAPPGLPRDWKGISGSPVFVAGKVLGVICTCPEVFEARRLHAVPMARLLEDAGFRDAIGYNERQERLDGIRREVEDRIRGCPEAMEALRKELGVPDRSGDPHALASDIAKQLLNIEIARVIRATNQAHRKLPATAQAEEARQATRDVAFVLLPVLYDGPVVQSVASKVARDSGACVALVSLPVATKTLAEIVMAGVDARAADFRPPTKDREFPAGKLSLAHPPEGGKNAPFDTFEDAWHQQMIEAFAAPDARLSFRDNSEALIQSASRQLDHERREYGRTHYFVFTLPDKDGQLRAWRAMFDRLKERYPAIVFLELSTDWAVRAPEEELLLSFRDLIHRAHGRDPIRGGAAG